MVASKIKRGDNSTYTFTKRGGMYLPSATPTKLLINFYETLHTCSTQPADVHKGIWLLSKLKGEIIQLILSRKEGACTLQAQLLLNCLLFFMKLYTLVVHNLQMCMKEYGCCPKFKRGDNSTCTFTKRGGVYLVSATPPKPLIGFL